MVTGAESFLTVVPFTVPAVSIPLRGFPSASSSTAWRRLTPCAFITHSTAEPPVSHTAQRQELASERTTSEVPVSSWNGQAATRSAPCRVNFTPIASANRSTLSSVAIRAVFGFIFRVIGHTVLSPPGRAAGGPGVDG